MSNGTATNNTMVSTPELTLQSTPIILSHVFSKPLSVLTEYFNGTQTAQMTTVDLYVDNTTTAQLYVSNCLPNTLSHTSIYICEMIIYDTALSTTSRQYIEGYLASKWGIQSLLPAGHTYKSSTPPLTPDKYSVS